MNEIDWFIYEITRLRRSVQVYTELFTEKVPVEVLTSVSSEVFAIMQRAMHDEILISVTRLYGGKDNLSQFYIVSKHKSLLTDELAQLRNQTGELFKRLDIKDYRDTKIAHNDRTIHPFGGEIVKHNIDSHTLISLLETSLKLIIDIKLLLGNNSLPVRVNEKYERKGKELIEKLSKI